MKKADVEIGHTYLVKVSGKLAHVRITGESPYGGWDGVNTKTKRSVRIKSPQRLRTDLTDAKPQTGGTAMAKVKKQASKTGAKKAATKKADATKTTANKAGSKAPAKKAGAKQRPSEKAMELAAKDRAKAAEGDACPKCGKPLEVIDVDHKANKTVRGCPECDGSPLEAKRAERKAETDRLLAEKEAEDEKRQAEQAKAEAEKPKATGKPKRAKAKMSGLDAAAKVLAEAGQPMNCQDIVKAAFEKGYWASNGATPHATLYAAILRETQRLGADARFKKVGPGVFGLNDTGVTK